MNRPLVIYHGNCADGFSAAWCFWRKYGTGADYVAGVYQLRIRRPRSAEIWMMGLTVLFAMFGALAGCRLVMIHSPFILVLRVVNTSGLSHLSAGLWVFV